ncbi:MAG: alpha/beta hydrolase [Chloroflexota bacterium]
MGIAAWIIGGLAAALALAGNFMCSLSIARRRKRFLDGNPDLDGVGSVFGRDWVERYRLEPVAITAGDGLTLRGLWLAAGSPTVRTAIIVHGYSSRGVRMGRWAEFYHRLGYDVLLPDARGHGDSDGKYLCFGWPDRLDCLRWIDWICERQGRDREIVLHGVSMGGATVLMASGERLPDSVRCIISDCAYTSARDVLSYQMWRLFHVPPWPLLPIASLFCKLRAGFTFGEASALAQVRRSHTPTLFIHGGRDRFVPTAMVHRLYAACAAPKELFIVPAAGHALAYATDPEGYEASVRRFIGASAAE